MSVKMDGPALEGFLQEAFPQVAEDFRIEEVAAEQMRVRLVITEKHLRPGGTVSGPSMFALADVALYLMVLDRKSVV